MLTAPATLRHPRSMNGRPKKLSVMRSVSVDDAVRHFPALLERVVDRGEAFAIDRGGRTIAELAPAVLSVATLGTLRSALAGAGDVDADFASDLAEIRATQPRLPQDPWPS